jgi:hypothetical protein
MIKLAERVWDTFIAAIISMSEERAKKYLNGRHNHYM